ncbi:MAG: Crp/Fnr family transcriptional regulator [Leptolyngbya sp. SIOISBB]|nr:Crp/Fnr family transcriptional regulator [Leptolyngbya sp. SIOISBB]
MLTSVDRLLFVRGVPIFSELRDDFLVRLASIMDELSFPEQHTIFTEGQEGRALYIVVKGQVKVHLQDGQTLAELEAGACFGEMSLFDAEPRSASVTTIEACDCLILTQHQLYEAIDETPGIAINIIRLLSRRIRELNNDLKIKQQEAKTLSHPSNLMYGSEAQGSHLTAAAAAIMDDSAYATAEENGNLPYSSFPH